MNKSILNSSLLLIGICIGIILNSTLENRTIAPSNETDNTNRQDKISTEQFHSLINKCSQPYASKIETPTNLVALNNPKNVIKLANLIIGDEIDLEALREQKSTLRKSGQESLYIDFIINLPNHLHNKKDLITEALSTYQVNQIEDQSTLDKLIKEAKTIHQREPQNIGITSALIDTLQENQDTTAAIEIAKNTLAYDQSNAFLNYRLGLLYQENDDDANARFYFSIASAMSESYRLLIKKNEGNSEYPIN